MRSEVTIKQDQILEAAIRRFSHFGIAKTTLTEIADDLGVSKHVLAYYYPDKQKLIFSVEEKLTDDYISELQKELEKAATVERALSNLIEVKTTFFKKYFMLVLQAEQLELSLNPSHESWKAVLKERELQLLVPVFNKGVDNGELNPLDAEKTGALFLDTLHAFSRCIKDKGVLPDAAAFDEVFTKQQEVAMIFYKGLKKEPWKN